MYRMKWSQKVFIPCCMLIFVYFCGQNWELLSWVNYTLNDTTDNRFMFSYQGEVRGAWQAQLLFVWIIFKKRPSLSPPCLPKLVCTWSWDGKSWFRWRCSGGSQRLLELAKKALSQTNCKRAYARTQTCLHTTLHGHVYSIWWPLSRNMPGIRPNKSRQTENAQLHALLAEIGLGGPESILDSTRVCSCFQRGSLLVLLNALNKILKMCPRASRWFEFGLFCFFRWLFLHKNMTPHLDVRKWPFQKVFDPTSAPATTSQWQRFFCRLHDIPIAVSVDRISMARETTSPRYLKTAAIFNPIFNIASKFHNLFSSQPTQKNTFASQKIVDKTVGPLFACKKSKFLPHTHSCHQKISLKFTKQ